MSDWTQREKAEAYRPDLKRIVAHASREVDTILETTRERWDLEPESALDIGCGIGRHSTELAERGLDVLGVDISPTYVEDARARAGRKGVADAAEFRELDKRQLQELDGEFDLLVCAYNTFGYYDDETNRRILVSMRNRLSNGGVAVVEVTNQGSIPERNPSVVHRNVNDEYMFVVDQEYDPKSGMYTSNMLIFEEESAGFEYVDAVEQSVRLYAPSELSRLAREAAFSDHDVYRNFGGDQLHPRSQRLCLFAQK